MSAGRREQLAEVLMEELDNIGAFDNSNDEPRDRADIRLAVDRMIRQAQAEALEAAADAYESDDEQPHINRMAVEVYRPGDNLSSLWLRDRAAALRVSTSGTDQRLGDETTPAGTSTAAGTSDTAERH